MAEADVEGVARLQAALRALKSRNCLASTHVFAREVMAAQNLAPQAHHDLLLTALTQVVQGEIERLMIFMPPGSAKSTYGSVIMPAHAMAAVPGIQIIGASHTGDLAESFSRKVMGTLAEYGPDLLGTRPATEGVKGWEADNGSSYKPVGVGGPVTGRRADLLIIDDPVKSRADAASKLVRDNTFGWFLSDASTRLKPGARVVIIMTRWHEDDLAGRLLLNEPSKWKVIRIRAESRGPDDDPLGRPAGEFLWNDDPAYAYGALLAQAKEQFRRNRDMATWESLYQQDPKPGEGGLFQMSGVKILPSPPDDIKRLVRGWDLAATAAIGRGQPDWTAGVLMGERANGRFVVVHVDRFRGTPDDVERHLVETAKRDGKRCKIGLPQDPGQAGKSQVAYLTRCLRGFPVVAGLESGNKIDRAMPFASQWNAGNIDVVQGEWTADYLNELEMAPNGRFDDQMDGSSRAFNTMFGRRGSFKLGTLNWMGR